MVQVFDDPNNPNLRNVTVTANTTVPTIFMRWFNMSSTLVAATGNASRRDAVVMMVLDRSGSMGATCSDLIASAKLFTGQFSAGRDRIGLVTFSDGAFVASPPTTDFRTALGYDDGTSSGSGAIDNIVCKGGTGTANALSLGYNELYKMNLPGAFNVLFMETDGLPNTLTMNFWDSTTNTYALDANSNCADKNGKTMSAAGWTSAAVARDWNNTGGHAMGPNGLWPTSRPARLARSIPAILSLLVPVPETSSSWAVRGTPVRMPASTAPGNQRKRLYVQRRRHWDRH